MVARAFHLPGVHGQLWNLRGKASSKQLARTECFRQRRSAGLALVLGQKIRAQKTTERLLQGDGGLKACVLYLPGAIPVWATGRWLKTTHSAEGP